MRRVIIEIEQPPRAPTKKERKEAWKEGLRAAEEAAGTPEARMVYETALGRPVTDPMWKREKERRARKRGDAELAAAGIKT